MVARVRLGALGRFIIPVMFTLGKESVKELAAFESLIISVMFSCLGIEARVRLGALGRLIAS